MRLVRNIRKRLCGNFYREFPNARTVHMHLRDWMLLIGKGDGEINDLHTDSGRHGLADV